MYGAGVNFFLPCRDEFCLLHGIFCHSPYHQSDISTEFLDSVRIYVSISPIRCSSHEIMNAALFLVRSPFSSLSCHRGVAVAPITQGATQETIDKLPLVTYPDSSLRENEDTYALGPGLAAPREAAAHTLCLRFCRLQLFGVPRGVYEGRAAASTAL